eukprot:5241689-Alexandrium_andersonii.AAC.1
MASWSSKRSRTQSACQTHKEGEANVTGAARSAGYLTAVAASGVVVDIGEIIGAESLSQRYTFLAALAQRAPELGTVVHDDACHLRLMAEPFRHQSDLTRRLATFNYIIDRFHAAGH